MTARYLTTRLTDKQKCNEVSLEVATIDNVECERTSRRSARTSRICSSDRRRSSAFLLIPYCSTVWNGSEATLELDKSSSWPSCITSCWISAACKPSHGTASVHSHQSYISHGHTVVWPVTRDQCCKSDNSSQWERAKLPLTKLTPLNRQSPNIAHVIMSTISAQCSHATFGQDRPRGYFSPYSQIYHSFFFASFFVCMQKV